MIFTFKNSSRRGRRGFGLKVRGGGQAAQVLTGSGRPAPGHLAASRCSPHAVRACAHRVSRSLVPPPLWRRGRSVERASSPQKGCSAAWTGQVDCEPNWATGSLRPAHGTMGCCRGHKFMSRGLLPVVCMASSPPAASRARFWLEDQLPVFAAPRLDKPLRSPRTWAPGSASRTTYRPPPAPSLTSPS